MFKQIVLCIVIILIIGANIIELTNATKSQTNIPPSKPIINGTRNGTKNVSYNYTAISTDQDNDTIRYSIIWGDHTSYITESDFLPNGSIFTTNHTWIAAGKYTISVYASDNQYVSETSEFTVYIDAIKMGNIGYLIDIDGNGIFESFHNDTSNQEFDIDLDDGKYLIDEDGDRDWDYVYNKNTLTITEYNGEKEIPSEITAILNALVIGIILAIIITFIISFFYKQK